MIQYRGYEIEIIETNDGTEYQVAQNNIGRYGSLEAMKEAIDIQCGDKYAQYKRFEKKGAICQICGNAEDMTVCLDCLRIEAQFN